MVKTNFVSIAWVACLYTECCFIKWVMKEHANAELYKNWITDEFKRERYIYKYNNTLEYRRDLVKRQITL